MSVTRPDQTGQASALTVFTPIVSGEEDALRGYLEALHPSPLAKLERTHFGRWVVVDGLVTEPSQRRPDELRRAQLIFSASFDGPRDSYLDELCATIPDEARAIWGRCAGSGSASGAELKAYLLRNHVKTGLFFAAYADATVQQVRRAVDLRERVMGFAVRAQAMTPSALRQGFWDEFGP
jgi:hypothetical protein